MADQLHTAATDRDSTIEITVPLRTEHAATFRVIVASLGSDHGLSVDEIDDLKLAVSEVFTVLVDSGDENGPAGRASVTYSTTADSVTVDVERDGPGSAIELDALAATILASVVDEHRVSAAGVTLVKFGREAAH